MMAVLSLFFKKHLGKIGVSSLIVIVLALGYCSIKKGEKRAVKRAIKAESQKNKALSTLSNVTREKIKYQVQEELKQSDCKLDESLSDAEKMKALKECSRIKYD